MSQVDIIRAWKDEEYANSLTDLQRSTLPQNPAGLIELTDQDLLGAEGGAEAQPYTLNCTFSVFGTCITCFTCITFGCIISVPITVVTINPGEIGTAG
jgi:mersacidin/lichenicidin family type 2 lantibiotic